MENASPLKVDLRTELGKGPARRLRVAGKVPGVCYGKDRAPAHVAFDPKEFVALLTGPYGRNAVFQLDMGDSTEIVRVSHYQRDPLKRVVTHADFAVLDPELPIVCEVPLKLTGKPVGVAAGGKLRQVTHKVKISVKPADIPVSIDFDVTELDLGAVAKISAVTLPEGVALYSEGDYGVAQVFMPRGTKK
jgi:large subunit ribosomal protein L25